MSAFVDSDRIAIIKIIYNDITLEDKNKEHCHLERD